MSIEICVRLKEERERLGLIQQQMAELGGVTKTTLFNYENGREPSSGFLSAIAAAGADVLYILTGSRTAAVAPTLSPREQGLLNLYRGCSEEGKTAITQTSLALSKSAQGLKKKAA